MARWDIPSRQTARLEVLLVNRILEQLRALQSPRCQLCPRRCGADRAAEPGFCGQPLGLQVATVCSHRGEEPPLSGQRGAGTIFVVGCTMACRFCQNHQISQPERLDPGWRRAPEVLADRFLELQRAGSHNIEWVSPTQHLPGLVEALLLARRRGLSLPVVWNGNGYQRVSVLRLLEGIVDIYLPDAKYGDNATAAELSNTPDYVEVNRRALREMQRQVGSLELDPVTGIARRGLIIRHLVLPGRVANTREVLAWIARDLGRDTWISLMAQYYPAHRAASGLSRRLGARELRRALQALDDAGLENGWVQERVTARTFCPDFTRGDRAFEGCASAAAQEGR
jgi:putative pyruvate formate lyase activating enzyme